MRCFIPYTSEHTIHESVDDDNFEAQLIKCNVMEMKDKARNQLAHVFRETCGAPSTLTHSLSPSLQ